MIKTQVIKEDNKPVAVIMDYLKYIELKNTAEDRKDYHLAIETKFKNKKWTDHEDLKKKLGI
jgi:translation initiation factor IF-3